MSNERMDGVHNPLIIKWIGKFSKIPRNILNEVKIPKDSKKIENSYIKHCNG
jgi:hypothetical protein